MTAPLAAGDLVTFEVRSIRSPTGERTYLDGEVASVEGRLVWIRVAGVGRMVASADVVERRK